jgi:hypothetical protein
MNRLQQVQDAPRAGNPKSIPRLLIVSDAAIADVTQLPRSVRALIDASAELFVATPNLPGRVSWLADDLDPSREVAEGRLQSVLSNMRAIGAEVRGMTAHDTVLTAIGDAVAEWQPDHILVALRGPEHAHWQEKGLIDRIEGRFNLPVTTYVVDPLGHN